MRYGICLANSQNSTRQDNTKETETKAYGKVGTIRPALAKAKAPVIFEFVSRAVFIRGGKSCFFLTDSKCTTTPVEDYYSLFSFLGVAGRN